jgi:hypothetical protein
VWVLANRGSRTAPFVFNPQGLEEFGATDPSRAPFKRLGYWPLRAAVRRCAQAADRVIATDRALVTPVLAHLRVRPDVVRVVPNAIDPGDCDRREARALAVECVGVWAQPEDAVERPAAQANGDSACCCARFHRSLRKNICLHWRWVLVGDGRCEGLCARGGVAGISEHVVLWGGRTQDLHGC